MYYLHMDKELRRFGIELYIYKANTMEKLTFSIEENIFNYLILIKQIISIFLLYLFVNQITI